MLLRFFPALLFFVFCTVGTLALLWTPASSDPSLAQQLLQQEIPNAEWIVIVPKHDTTPVLGGGLLVGEKRSELAKLLQVTMGTDQLPDDTGIELYGFRGIHSLQVSLSPIGDSGKTLVGVRHRARRFVGISPTSYQQFLSYFAQCCQTQSEVNSRQSKMEP